MTDVSISEQSGISYQELDKKIEQISRYIQRVHQRNKTIDNFIKANRKATMDGALNPLSLKKGIKK